MVIYMNGMSRRVKITCAAESWRLPQPGMFPTPLSTCITWLHYMWHVTLALSLQRTDCTVWSCTVWSCTTKIDWVLVSILSEPITLPNLLMNPWGRIKRYQSQRVLIEMVVRQFTPRQFTPRRFTPRQFTPDINIISHVLLGGVNCPEVRQFTPGCVTVCYLDYVTLMSNAPEIREGVPTSISWIMYQNQK